MPGGRPALIATRPPPLSDSSKAYWCGSSSRVRRMPSVATYQRTIAGQSVTLISVRYNAGPGVEIAMNPLWQRRGRAARGQGNVVDVDQSEESSTIWLKFRDQQLV